MQDTRNIIEEKNKLRKLMRKKRDSLSAEEREIKSNSICNKLFLHPKFNVDLSSKNIMIYLNFSTEVSTGEIIKTLWQKNANVYVPKIESFKEKTMFATEYNSKSEMIKNKYGIKEPKKNKIIHPSELDFVILPALALSEKGLRIGYGGAYYDKFLYNLDKNCLKIGIVFKEQIIEEIPFESHDIKLDVTVFD